MAILNCSVRAILLSGTVLGLAWGQTQSRTEDQPGTRHRTPQERLAQLEEIVRHNPPLRTEFTPHLAYHAFKAGDYFKAESYAVSALNLSTSESGEPAANASIYGHEVLGLLALKQGAVEPAKLHLLESAKTKGTYLVNKNGPNMELAKALLDKGERDTVIQYLELCKAFWRTKEGLNSLLAWQGAIRAGAMPDFDRQLFIVP